MPNLIEHKRAHFSYELLERFEAGVQLFGTEVKSIRDKNGKLEGSHVTVRGGEAFLLNSEIPPFQAANAPSDYDPKRNRRLLLTKKEIAKISNAEDKQGLTIVPIAMYNKGRVIKLSLAIARGKKKGDKRAAIMQKEHIRDVARAAKNEVQKGMKYLRGKLP
jgi:SsrA-binding protein